MNLLISISLVGIGATLATKRKYDRIGMAVLSAGYIYASITGVSWN